MMQRISNYQLYRDAAPLAKLQARCLSTLANQKSHSALEIFKGVVQRMENTNLEVKRYWNNSVLSTAISDDDIGKSSFCSKCKGARLMCF